MSDTLVERNVSAGTTLATTINVYADAGVPKQTTSSRTTGNWTFAYDRGGRPASVTSPGGTTTTTLTYNLDDTLASHEVKAGASSLARFAYNYDALERITLQDYTGLPGPGGSHVTDDLTYAYDDAGRLDYYRRGATTIQATFDADGNRTFWDGDTYSYRADGSILDVNAGTDYTYKPFGGVLAGDGKTYDYDGFDRTTKIDPTGTEVATFTYDGLDRQRRRNRTKPSGSAEQTDFSYAALGRTVVDETVAGTDTAYILDPAGSALAVSKGTLQLLTDDGGGNVSTALTTTGGVACTVRYDPFGDPLSAQGGEDGNPCNTGSTHSHVFYRGGEREPGSGTYQWGSRTYDPGTASFLTPDTYRAGSGRQNLSVGVDPLTRNRYAYVNGDPVNLFDPTGHSACRWYNPLSYLDCVRSGKEGVTRLLRAASPYQPPGGPDDPFVAGLQSVGRALRSSPVLRATAVVTAVLGVGALCVVTVGVGCAVAAGIGAGLGATAGAIFCPAGTSRWRCAGIGGAGGAVALATFAVAAPAITAALPAGLPSLIAGGISIGGAGAVGGGAGSMVEQFAATGDVDFGRVGRDALLSGGLALGGYGLGRAVGPLATRLRARLAGVGEGPLTAPQTARFAQDIAVDPMAPRALPLNRPIGLSRTQNEFMQSRIAWLQERGAIDFRVNQQQLNISGARAGINRPDLQYTLNGQRFYEEFDRFSSWRGLQHQARTLANDPKGAVNLFWVE
jgi:RHS repeat-associated protein